MQTIGIVIIGRNEGSKLALCLNSVLNQQTGNILAVYVDSGSTDHSIEVAKNLGFAAIALDSLIPFTAARGRNAGFHYLVRTYPLLREIQFIDGDCELSPNWLERSIAELDSDPSLAVVCGRRHERYPEASIFNRLVDLEWNTPIGDVSTCGGDSLMSVQALQEVGGFNETLICGEEPELCIRLNRKGWKIRRIQADMTVHDAAMYRFDQWWKRSQRTGWSIAEGQAMYGSAPEHYMVRESLSGWLWGLLLPLCSIGLSWSTHGLSLILFIGYPILMIRIFQFRCHQGDVPKYASLYAVFCVCSKFPQIWGQLQYCLSSWQDTPRELIEYKSSIVNDR